jgi:hypothetical protein
VAEDQAFGRLLRRLDDGLTLSGLVRERIDFADWTCSPTIGPADADLDTGGVVSGTAALEQTAVWLHSQLAAIGDAFLVAEDWLRRPGDPHVDDLRHANAVGQELYHVVLGRPDVTEIREVLWDAAAPHGLVFFAGPWNGGLDLDTLAGSAQLIGADAFDGESYLVARAPAT